MRDDINGTVTGFDHSFPLPSLWNENEVARKNEMNILPIGQLWPKKKKVTD